MIQVFEPSYDEMEERAVVAALRSKWVNVGPRTTAFENQFAWQVGAKYGVALNSCTAALYTSLKLLGVGPGDEVLVPSLTFAATATSVVQCGATPVFVDVEENSLLMDWEDAEKKRTARTKAAIPVMYAGQVKGYQTDLPLVYDCAHSAGSNFVAWGRTCCWSFNGVKNLAVGDGGMLTTDDPEFAERARRFTRFGIDKPVHLRDGLPWQYDIETPGEKLHMTDLVASVGLAQLDKLLKMQHHRKAIVRIYHEELKDYRPLPKDDSCGWHLFVIRHPNRDALHHHLKAKGVQSTVHYPPVHRFKCFYQGQNLPVTDKVFAEILTIPCHANLTLSDAKYICESIKSMKE